MQRRSATDHAQSLRTGDKVVVSAGSDQDLTKEQIRKRLMDARAAAGLTWDDVASEAGVAKSSLVTSITSGRTSMRRLDDMRSAMAQLCRERALELMQMATLLDDLPTNWRVDKLTNIVYLEAITKQEE